MFWARLVHLNSGSLNIQEKSSAKNRVHWKSGSLKSVHLESGSSKSVHQKSGSLKLVHWKPCSERCPFTLSLICGWPAREHYVAPAIVNWCYLIVTNLFSLSESHFFLTLSGHALTSCYFCTLPSWRDFRHSNTPIECTPKCWGLTRNSGCPCTVPV